MPAWLLALDRHFPIRYLTLLACAVVGLLGMFTWLAFDRGGWVGLLGLIGVAVGVRDLRQARHAILRNYPVIGHIRFLLEWIKGESDKRPFGTQLDVQLAGFEWLNHSLQPTKLDSHDFRVTIGPDRAQPYSASIFNISSMSFGALSANVIMALNARLKFVTHVTTVPRAAPTWTHPHPWPRERAGAARQLPATMRLESRFALIWLCIPS